MAVVINDFEVLSEPQPAPRTGTAEPAAATAPAKLEVPDVTAAVRIRDVRKLRTWAH